MPAFREQRVTYPDVMEDLDELPESLLAHAIPALPKAVTDVLDGMNVLKPFYSHRRVANRHRAEFYTDGTAAFPEVPLLTVAAYAIVDVNGLVLEAQYLV